MWFFAIRHCPNKSYKGFRAILNQIITKVRVVDLIIRVWMNLDFEHFFLLLINHGYADVNVPFSASLPVLKLHLLRFYLSKTIYHLVSSKLKNVSMLLPELVNNRIKTLFHICLLFFVIFYVTECYYLKYCFVISRRLFVIWTYHQEGDNKSIRNWLWSIVWSKS